MLHDTKVMHLNMRPPLMFRMVLTVWGPKQICRTIVRNRGQITIRWAICPWSTARWPNRNIPKCLTLRLAIYTSRTNRRAINSIRNSRAYSPPDNRPKSRTWTWKTWWGSLIGSPITDTTRAIMAIRISRRTETRKMIWCTFRERKVPRDSRGLKILMEQFQAL